MGRTGARIDTEVSTFSRSILMEKEEKPDTPPEPKQEAPQENPAIRPALEPVCCGSGCQGCPW
jgi:hypothetical protein